MLYYTLIHGLIISFIGSIVLLGSIGCNPRMWLQDYPKAVKNKVPPSIIFYFL